MEVTNMYAVLRYALSQNFASEILACYFRRYLMSLLLISLSLLPPRVTFPSVIESSLLST